MMSRLCLAGKGPLRGQATRSCPPPATGSHLLVGPMGRSWEGKGVLVLGVGMRVAMSPAGEWEAREGGSWDPKVVETPVGRFAQGKDCWSADGWFCGVRDSFMGARGVCYYLWGLLPTFPNRIIFKPL